MKMVSDDAIKKVIEAKGLIDLALRKIDRAVGYFEDDKEFSDIDLGTLEKVSDLLKESIEEANNFLNEVRIMSKVRYTKNYLRYRQFSPKKCAPTSFRIKQVSPQTKLVICCPKGNFSKGRCLVGTKTQSILRRR